MKADTGLDISGYRRAINTGQVRHVFNRHRPGNEKDPNQLPISAEAVAVYLDVMENPDKIIPRIRSGSKASRIKYRKQINGMMVVIEEVRTGQRTLAFFDM